MQEFNTSHFLNLISEERELKLGRHFQTVRGGVKETTADIRKDLEHAARKSKERKQREGHLSQNPDQVLSLLRIFEESPTFQAMTSDLLERSEETVANAGRAGCHTVRP